MNLLLKFSLCACLSLAAGWGGRALAMRLHRERENAALARPGATAHPVAGEAAATEKETTGNQSDSALAAQKAVARCTTKALWDMTLPDLHIPSALRDAVARELLDREGVAALARCEALPDRQTAGEWTGCMLEILIESDCWKGLELYRALPEDLAGLTGRSLATELVEAAAETSSDSMIGMLDALKDSHADIYFNGEYPQGFDFQKVLDHVLESGREGPALTPAGLLGNWAERSPLAALEWARAHPDYEDWKIADSPAQGAVQRVMMALCVDGEGPERREALLRIAQYLSPAEREEAWLKMGGSYFSVDPELAKIAAEMGPGDAQRYLVNNLAATRGSDSVDPRWAEIPAELRDPAMTQALADWRKEDPTPRGDRAREYWKAAMERVFNK